MLQVKTFRVPEEDNKANEFLRTHSPEGQINFNKDTWSSAIGWKKVPNPNLQDMCVGVFGNKRFAPISPSLILGSKAVTDKF